MLKIDVIFEQPYFYDLPPEVKTTEELTVLILSEVCGRKVSMDKYNDREISRCARQLIVNGCLRGTVFGFEECAWSRITPKGKIFLDYLESANMATIEY